jgi:hypothetical protein
MAAKVDLRSVSVRDLFEAGEEVVDFGIIRAGTRAKVCELTREEAGRPDHE